MKIAFLLTQSLENPSGLGRYGPLARELSNLGHHVEVFALHPISATLRQEHISESNLHVHYVAPMHVRRQGSQKTYYPAYQLLSVVARATYQLSLAAIRSQAEILHIGKPHPMNSIAGLIGKYLRHKTLFLDCDDYEAESNRFSSSWQKRVVAAFEKRIPQHVKRITTNTHAMQEKLISWGVPQERIFYLPNGVDPHRFKSPNPERVIALRSELNLQGRKVISYIGSLSLTNHAVDLLLEAFARLQAQMPETRLLLVGGGEDIEKLQSQASRIGLSDKTIFRGRVAPEEVPIYYHLSDVTVDPVYDDDAARCRCPLKLFESWASGVPFVTADVGDRRMLAGSPEALLLARPGDPDSLASLILRVLNDQDISAALKQRGLQRVENFYYDRLAKDLESLYSSCPNPSG